MIKGRGNMNFNKNTIIIIFLFAIIGAFTFADSLSTVSADNSTWIAFNSSNVGMSSLTATITATIKNTGSAPAYFKISQVYSYFSTGDITWTVPIGDTNPTAEYMIDNTNPGNSPDTNQDIGWEIQPGQTKTVTFTAFANGTYFATNSDTAIENTGAVTNTYWPLIPDMGLYTSWFEPNEIQSLNPNLQLKSWTGTFCFIATNIANDPVSGIIRGPIIPLDSQLVSSNPAVTFQDKDILGDTGVAAWDVNMASGESDPYTYTYKWPLPNNGSVSGKGSSVFAPAGNSNNNTTTTVPSPNGGIPLGLFGLAAAMVGAGVAYSKFLR
jgi:hypothetical protein